MLTIHHTTTRGPVAHMDRLGRVLCPKCAADTPEIIQADFRAVHDICTWDDSAPKCDRCHALITVEAAPMVPAVAVVEHVRCKIF